MATTRDFRRARFTFGEAAGEIFEGFTNGEAWNGFACPYFSHEIARAVLVASEQNGYSWRYDRDKDAFFVRHSDDPENYAEEFSAIKAVIEGQDTVLYAIGAYSWVWMIS